MDLAFLCSQTAKSCSPINIPEGKDGVGITGEKAERLSPVGTWQMRGLESEDSVSALDTTGRTEMRKLESASTVTDRLNLHRQQQAL